MPATPTNGGTRIRNPYNPLDEFQSYSVHYLLLAARTTVAARQFADPQYEQTSLQAVNRVKKLGEPVNFGGNDEDVFLVIDTRRFGQFQVESLKYDVYINGLQKGSSMSNLAADLQLVVIDSVGISFANYLQYLMDEKMQTNYDGMVFMLRTIFVGHNADGTSQTVQSETIPMHLQRVEINLDYAKGIYTMDFMPNMNFDVNRFSRFITINTATTYNSGNGNTLGGVIDSLQKELNRKSDDYFSEVQEVVKKSIGKTRGRKVQYQITIPDKWKKFEIKGVNSNESVELLFKRQADEAARKSEAKGQIKSTNVSTKIGMPIDKVLEAIFRQCPEVAKLGNFKTNDADIVDGFCTFFKQIIGITSTRDVFTVHVDVIEFKVPNQFTRKAQAKKNATLVSKQEDEFYVTETVNGVQTRRPKDLLEWDYIFTGLNKDILDFEMKIQEFQFLLASNLKIGDGSLAVNEDPRTAEEHETYKALEELIYTRPLDPLMLPLTTKSQQENVKQYGQLLAAEAERREQVKSAQRYAQNLAMFYAASPITVKLRIKGNPLIMHKFNMGTFLKNPVEPNLSPNSSAPLNDKDAYRKDLEERILKSSKGQLTQNDGGFVLQDLALSQKSYATAPVFAHIRIKGPNVDPTTNEELEGSFSTSVVSQNYYVVFAVSNIIERGVFTQELELYSHNLFGRTNSKIERT